MKLIVLVIIMMLTRQKKDRILGGAEGEKYHYSKILDRGYGIGQLVSIYPLFWIIINSFKPTSEIVSKETFSMPKSLFLDHYYTAIVEKNILTYFFNSLFITICTIILTVIVSTMLGYAATRTLWRFGNKLIAIITLGILLPSQIVVAPVFIRVATLG